VEIPTINLPSFDFYHASVGLLLKGKEVFITQRQATQSMPGFWEFPGGKVEQSETSLMALKRELDEEVGVKVIETKQIMSLCNPNHRWLAVWLVCEFEGIPFGKENQNNQWININDIETVKLLPANKYISMYLKTQLQTD